METFVVFPPETEHVSCLTLNKIYVLRNFQEKLDVPNRYSQRRCNSHRDASILQMEKGKNFIHLKIEKILNLVKRNYNCT